jgi:hypothetical chaperone protein
MYCAIDFGTSNSAVCIPDGATGVRLVELEAGYPTMPTAVFYAVEGHAAQPVREFGRAAVAAYVDGIDGRLMRSMKSILGSTLIDQTTDIGGGRAVKYLDVVTGYLQRLKACAEAAADARITHVVLGRPVFFVDDDPRVTRRRSMRSKRPRARPGSRTSASNTSRSRRRSTTSAAPRPSRSCWSPTSAAAPPTSRSSGSDRARRALDRKPDILANHGVHIAGTDFDRRIELASILPELGYGAFGPPAPARRRARCRARSTSTSRPGT